MHPRPDTGCIYGNKKGQDHAAHFINHGLQLVGMQVTDSDGTVSKGDTVIHVTDAADPHLGIDSGVTFAAPRVNDGT